MRGLLTVLVLGVGAASSQAQDSQRQTTIDLTFDTVDTRLRPCCSSNNYGHHELQVMLSQNNAVSTSQKSKSGKFLYEGSDSFVLGHANKGEYASVVWHVLGKNQLVSQMSFPQNVRTMVINVSADKTCTFRVTDKLKPGFSEYTFGSISLHQLAYYFPIETTGTTCSIH